MKLGDLVMARTDTGCVFGTLTHLGHKRAALQRQGQPQQTWTTVDRLREWPPPPPAPSKRARRGR
jgi:hypothetical protein